MKNSVFLHTNGWLALLNATENLHQQSLDRWLDLLHHGRQIVLTNWVIAETGNGLSRSRKKNLFASVVEEMMEAPGVDLIWVDRKVLTRALSAYVQHADKSWGLVDCASFVVMQEHGISEAFTSDRHFEQAGFRCLLSA